MYNLKGYNQETSKEISNKNLIYKRYKYKRYESLDFFYNNFINADYIFSPRKNKDLFILMSKYLDIYFSGILIFLHYKEFKPIYEKIQSKFLLPDFTKLTKIYYNILNFKYMRLREFERFIRSLKILERNKFRSILKFFFITLRLHKYLELYKKNYINEKQFELLIRKIHIRIKKKKNIKKKINNELTVEEQLKMGKEGKEVEEEEIKKVDDLEEWTKDNFKEIEEKVRRKNKIKAENLEEGFKKIIESLQEEYKLSDEEIKKAKEEIKKARKLARKQAEKKKYDMKKEREQKKAAGEINDEWTTEEETEEEEEVTEQEQVEEETEEEETEEEETDEGRNQRTKIQEEIVAEETLNGAEEQKKKVEEQIEKVHEEFEKFQHLKKEFEEELKEIQGRRKIAEQEKIKAEEQIKIAEQKKKEMEKRVRKENIKRRKNLRQRSKKFFSINKRKKMPKKKVAVSNILKYKKLLDVLECVEQFRNTDNENEIDQISFFETILKLVKENSYVVKNNYYEKKHFRVLDRLRQPKKQQLLTVSMLAHLPFLKRPKKLYVPKYRHRELRSTQIFKKEFGISNFKIWKITRKARKGKYGGVSLDFLSFFELNLRNILIKTNFCQTKEEAIKKIKDKVFCVNGKIIINTNETIRPFDFISCRKSNRKKEREKFLLQLVNQEVHKNFWNFFEYNFKLFGCIFLPFFFKYQKKLTATYLTNINRGRFLIEKK